ncbi:hypothetical protein B9Z19DRAFT_525950 [Tuber borchii]|uniref:Uncharacterized protein n=1 Tax=Tuber borchii TaxID=42251 RepID=A0A2T6ZDQ0_TUBBO|nr:hypothetical protein B9Z19DRAFT_525950 [Tuber borchii]
MLHCWTRRRPSTLSFPRPLQIVLRMDPPLFICSPFWSLLTSHHHLPPLQQSRCSSFLRYRRNMFSELPPPPPSSKRHQIQASVQTTIASRQPSKGLQSRKVPKPLDSYNSNRTAGTVPAPPRENPCQTHRTKESVIRALSNTTTAFVENEPPADSVSQQSRYFQSQSTSSLSALHDAAYFNEDDFESDGDLNFDDSITITTAPSTAGAGAPSLPIQGMNPPPPKTISEDIHYGGTPSSSAPVDWSSSPAEHFAKPGGAMLRGSAGRPMVIEEDPEEVIEEAHQPKKRKLMPWGDRDGSRGAASNSNIVTPDPPARSKRLDHLWDMTASDLKKANRKRLDQKRAYSTSSATDAAPAKAGVTVQRKLKLSDEQQHVLDIVLEGGGKGIFFTGSAGQLILILALLYHFASPFTGNIPHSGSGHTVTRNKHKVLFRKPVYALCW